MLFSLACALMIVAQAPAEAGGPRARLSRDLADRLASGRDGLSSIIVSGTPEKVAGLAARHGARVKKAIHGGAVLEVTTGQLAAMSEDPELDHASGDVPVSRAMAVTTESTGATQVWGDAITRGFTGRGVGVAVIDSGVARHKDLRARIVASVDFTGRRGEDAFGHGTHIAGIIAGGGDAGYAGIAPGAHVISLRVLGADGSGRTSDVIDAIDWAVAHRAEYRIRVINLSLGHAVLESYRDDPLCAAVQRAVDAGIVVVAAAGNLGKTSDGRPVVGGIISPGNAPGALTVGAVNTFGTPQRSDDRMATYSSRGPTSIDRILKPEIAAPGNRIVATGAAKSYLTETYPERVVAGQGSHPYMQMSGTSMASAVVAGAVALLLEAHPALTPADAKLALQLTSSRVQGAGLIESGAGSVNVASALKLVAGEGLVATTIAGEAAELSGVGYGSVSQIASPWSLSLGVLRPETPVWAGSAPGATIESTILVWGNALVWGNILVWGNQTVTPDILVWGNALITPDILVWGDAWTDDDDVSGTILVWNN